LLLQVRTVVSRDFEAALQEFDVLMSPVATTPAYKFGEKTDDPLSMYLGDLMTVNLNLAGLPAVSLNCGFHQEGTCTLPIGMQFIGTHLSEPQLLGVAHAIELTHAPAQTFPQ
jgi:aspartyl-tRNA(Asn)/glutamyl-tRNA(Gln) amidotransferase subunit A